MKDQQNKKSHEYSAQLACEAAASIRTVASLTREDDCCIQYSESLETPLKKSNRTAIWSNLLFAFSQATVFFAIALVFWYGSRLVSFQEFTLNEFYIGLMVRVRKRLPFMSSLPSISRPPSSVPSNRAMSSHSC